MLWLRLGANYGMTNWIQTWNLLMSTSCWTLKGNWNILDHNSKCDQMSQKHILANKYTNFELFSNACFTLVSKVTIHFKIFNVNSMLSMLHTGLANFQNCPCGVSLRIFYRMLSIPGWDLLSHLWRVDKIQGRKGRIRIFYSPAGSSVLGKTLPEVSTTARGCRPRTVLKTECTVFPNSNRPSLVNNIFTFFLHCTKSLPKYSEWFRAVITARSFLNWTISERVNGN